MFSLIIDIILSVNIVIDSMNIKEQDNSDVSSEAKETAMCLNGCCCSNDGVFASYNGDRV